VQEKGALPSPDFSKGWVMIRFLSVLPATVSDDSVTSN
jgi:hypothetical protein